MKNHFSKILSLMLVIAMLISLAGCNTDGNENDDKTNDSENNETTKNDSNFTEGTTCIIPNSYLLGYSISTSSETYNYGDEIDINITVDIPKGDYLPFAATDEVGTFSIGFRIDGPAILATTFPFEIIGDKEVLFENVKLNEYYHGDENGKAFSANFKIKITDPTYVVEGIKFIARFKANDESVSGGKAFCFLPDLYFVGDSQGIIVSGVPYNLDQNLNIISTPDREIALMKKSLEREYAAGIDTEVLIDRYIKYISEERCYIFCGNENDENCIAYISEDVRFKIYLPTNHLLLEQYEECKTGFGSRKNYSKEFLDFAFENKVITEEEYTCETKRIAELEQMGNTAIFDQPSRFFEDSTVQIPEGDDYYNIVADLRNDS